MITVACATLQTDHHAIGQLSTGKPPQSLAVQTKGAQACEDCSAAQRAVADFRQRLEVVEAAKAARDSKQAQSMPSTQDQSGDTNDDRCGSAMSAAVNRALLNCANLTGTGMIETTLPNHAMRIQMLYFMSQLYHPKRVKVCKWQYGI